MGLALAHTPAFFHGSCSLCFPAFAITAAVLSAARGRGVDGRPGDRDAGRRDFNRGGGRGGARGGRGGRGGYGRWDDRRNATREASVEVDPSWKVVEELPFSALSKLSHDGVGAPETLLTAGSLEFYDRTYDRITTKADKPLARFEHRPFHYTTTTDDPIIRRLAGTTNGTVFATGPILSLLMMAPRGVASWDVVVQRVGDQLFFDKRDGSLMDVLTVNETAHDPPRDEKSLLPGEEVINSAQALALESTLVNQHFSQTVLTRGKRHTYPEDNPFMGDDVTEEAASVAYRYRKWTLADGITLVARCDVDGAAQPPPAGGRASAHSERAEGEPLTLVIKALNEAPEEPTARSGPTADWRSKLDNQRGAVLATELKNNSVKLARWTAGALLAGADQMKLGFVARAHPRDATAHVILGTQVYKPREFASQIGLSEGNMWGIFKQFVELCFKHVAPGTKGLLMKDPNKPVVRLYLVPDGFESEDSEDEEEAADADGEGEDGDDGDGEDE